MSDKPDKPIEYDPVFLNARREAIVIFSIWVVCLLWSVPFCYMYGYPSSYEAGQFTTLLGIPTWLFWGIAAPWLLANVATVWFCFAFMKDDDLGRAPDEAPEHDEAPSQEDAS